MYEQKETIESSHLLLKRYLSQYQAGTRVLDVGTASGFLGKLLKDFSFRIVGVEPNEIWARQAGSYYDHIYIAELEKIPDSDLTGFDVVVCADVLEHMPAPEKQLRRLVDLQDTSSKFFISVPNVANLWIRLNLLFGRFEYTNRGILDRTHLRFFTYKSVMDLLINSGLRIDKIDVTPIPLPLVSSFFVNSRIGKSVNRLLIMLTPLFPTLLGYQFCCLASIEDKNKDYPNA